jgi:ATP-dependent DNA helicase RecQ
MLLAYFGEKEADECGKCDVCLAKKSREMKSSTKNKIPNEIMALLENGKTRIEKIIESLDYPEKLVIESIRFLSDNGLVRIVDNKIAKK